MPRYLRGIVGMTKGAGALGAPKITKVARKVRSGVGRVLWEASDILFGRRKVFGAAALIITMGVSAIVPSKAFGGNAELKRALREKQGVVRMLATNGTGQGEVTVPPETVRKAQELMRKRAETPSNATPRGGAAETDDKKLSDALKAARGAALDAAAGIEPTKTHAQMVEERTGMSVESLNTALAPRDPKTGALLRPVNSTTPVSGNGNTGVRSSVSPRPGGN